MNDLAVSGTPRVVHCATAQLPRTDDDDVCDLNLLLAMTSGPQRHQWPTIERERPHRSMRTHADNAHAACMLTKLVSSQLILQPLHTFKIKEVSLEYLECQILFYFILFLKANCNKVALEWSIVVT